MEMDPPPPPSSFPSPSPHDPPTTPTVLLPPPLPQSVEEAGALLGAAITRYYNNHSNHNAAYSSHPPEGMPSVFASTLITHHQCLLPSADLWMRLYQLRSFLGLGLSSSSSSSSAITSAPSILAVLMKLLSMNQQHPHSATIHSSSSSSSTSSSSSNNNMGGVFPTMIMDAAPSKSSAHSPPPFMPPPPPLLSIPIRRLWCDCVVRCHRLLQQQHKPSTYNSPLPQTSSSSSSFTSVSVSVSVSSLSSWVQHMCRLAVLHPRSHRASGGVRISALQVLAIWYENQSVVLHNDNNINNNRHTLLQQEEEELLTLVLQTCGKALKSAGVGDPAYRTAALELACAAVAVVTRGGKGVFLTDPHRHEAVRILKQAATDACDAVRAQAGTLATRLAPCAIIIIRLHNHNHHNHHNYNTAVPPPSSSTATTAAANNSSRAHAHALHAMAVATLDEILSLALKHIDDVSPYVAHNWACAVAQCVYTSLLEYQSYYVHSAVPSPPPPPPPPHPSSIAQSATSWESALNRIVDLFILVGVGVGGDPPSSYFSSSSASSSSSSASSFSLSVVGSNTSAAAAARAMGVGGGAFSAGGRAIRVGLTLGLVQLLRLHNHHTTHTNTTMTTTTMTTMTTTAAASTPHATLPNKITGSSENHHPIPAGTLHNSKNSSTTKRNSVGTDTTTGGTGPAHGRLEPRSLIRIVLRMLGDPRMNAQLKNNNNNNNVHKGGGKSEVAPLVRAATSRVLRQGLSEGATEPFQRVLLHELLSLLTTTSSCTDGAASTTSSSSATTTTTTTTSTTIPPKSTTQTSSLLNAHQLQVVLIEIACLITTLGEAADSILLENDDDDDDRDADHHQCKENESVVNLTASLAFKALTRCLCHKDHGVRHEAALACRTTVACCMPVQWGRQFLHRCLNEIQFHHAELMNVSMMITMPLSNRRLAAEEKNNASSATADQISSNIHAGGGGGGGGGGVGLRMFRRAASLSTPKESASSVDPSLPAQFAIHGWSLTASLLLQTLPRVAVSGGGGGLPKDLWSRALSVAEILVSFQFNEELSAVNPGAVCLSVRSGFAIMSGLLTSGSSHHPIVSLNWTVFLDAWKKSCKHAIASTTQSGSPKAFAPRHDLFCLDGMLSCVVIFLKHCSHLILTVPEALSQLTRLLEESMHFFAPPTGRLTEMTITPPPVLARIESSKSSLLEAFAWLPSGSFPLAADQVFQMAAMCVREAIDEDVPCSLLASLVSKEDAIVDAKPACYARLCGQLGGARDMEETIATLTSDAVLHSEREAVILLRSSVEEPTTAFLMTNEHQRGLFLESSILGAFAADPPTPSAPTPLHEVGAWREPITPSNSSRTRLVDAAIQAYSATFGMNNEKEQHMAMTMLESLLPNSIVQAARTLGINTELIEQDKKFKGRDDIAVVNITAIILSCLKSIPLFESTHNVPIALSPQWMKKAKELLLAILPSTIALVRRAAAEGLALVATMGVAEDARFMQSTILHSLDELMRVNRPDGKPRVTAPEATSAAARSGALLTLASIQRTSQKVKQRQLNKARERARSYGDDEVVASSEDELPVLQMMTRILPTVGFYGECRDYLDVRMCALHSFALLLFYSGRLDALNLDEVGMQLLRKSIELIEINFGVAWTSTNNDFDRTREDEKMTSEVGFLSVLLRSMTLLVPYLRYVLVEYPNIGRRFAIMASVILELYAAHPVVYVEVMAFFEVLARYRPVMPSVSDFVNADENPYTSCVASLVGCNSRPGQLADYNNKDALVSPRCMRAAAVVAQALTVGKVFVTAVSDMRIVPALLSMVEVAVSARCAVGASALRSLSAPHDTEQLFFDYIALETEAFDVVLALLLLEQERDVDYADILLRWNLLSRAVLSASLHDDMESIDQENMYSRAGVIIKATLRATSDASLLFKNCHVPRSQVKTLAMQLGTECLRLFVLISDDSDRGSDPNLDMRTAASQVARLCRTFHQAKQLPPPSRIVLHLEGIISSACATSNATLDHSELRALQRSAITNLYWVIAAFGKVKDIEEPELSILDQYSTQIFSSIKHSLSCLDGSEREDTILLFKAGCDCFERALSIPLTTDPIILKRLIRFLIPNSADASLFESTQRPPTPKFDDPTRALFDTRDRPLAVCCKVAALCGIFTRVACNNSIVGSVLTKVRDEILRQNELQVAIFAAALAIDGARLLLGNKLTLAGRRPRDTNEPLVRRPMTGFLLESINHQSESLKALLVRSWSACACFAIGPLLNRIAQVDERSDDTATSEAYTSWAKAIFALLVAGVYDADAARSTVQEDDRPSHLAAFVLDPVSIELDCLRGLHVAVPQLPSRFVDLSTAPLAGFLDLLRSSILIPSLIVTKESTYPYPDIALVEESCSFLVQLASLPLPNCHVDVTSLLKTLLQPLHLLQEDRIAFAASTPNAAKIVSTCFSAMVHLIRTPSVIDDAIVQAMPQIVLYSVLGRSHSSLQTPITVIDDDNNGNDDENNNNHNVVQNAAWRLLAQCLRCNAMSRSHVSRLALRLIQEDEKEKQWTAWLAVVALDETCAALSASIEPLRNALVVSTSLSSSSSSSSNEPQQQQAVLTSILRLCLMKIPGMPTKVSTSSEHQRAIITTIISLLGADILNLVWAYGTNLTTFRISFPSYYKSICADALKIQLLGYQQLSAAATSENHTGDDDAITVYMQILMECLVAVLRCNGVPHHPLPIPSSSDAGSDAVAKENHGSDVLLGQWAAQVLLTLARTSPAAFKTCVATHLRTAVDRAWVEVAVRSAMAMATTTMTATAAGNSSSGGGGGGGIFASSSPSSSSYGVVLPSNAAIESSASWVVQEKKNTNEKKMLNVAAFK